MTEKMVASLEPRDKQYKLSDAKVTGLFVRVQPTGRKSYYCYYRVKGKGTQVKLGSTEILSLKQAREDAAEVLLSARKGVNEAQERKRKECSTLAGFVENRYATWVQSQQKHPEATLRTLNSTFKHLLKTPLDEITVEKVDRWRAKQTIATSTVNRYITTLKTALGKAYEWGYIDAHPLDNLKKQREPEQVIRWLDDSEVAALLAALEQREQEKREARRTHNEWLVERGEEPKPTADDYEASDTDYLRPLVVTGLATGMRISELLRLTWADVTLTGGRPMITVRDTKSGKVRYVPVNDEAQMILKGWQRYSTALHGKHSHVFVSAQGRPMQSVKKAWNALCERAGVQAGFHAIRRTTGSRLVQSGVNMYVVAQILGHSDIKVTQKHYAALGQDDTAQALQILASVQL